MEIEIFDGYLLVHESALNDDGFKRECYIEAAERKLYLRNTVIE